MLTYLLWWYCVGLVGVGIFVYNDFYKNGVDVRLGELFPLLLAALLGPVALLLVALMYCPEIMQHLSYKGVPLEQIVLIRGKKEKPNEK